MTLSVPSNHQTQTTSPIKGVPSVGPISGSSSPTHKEPGVARSQARGGRGSKSAGDPALGRRRVSRPDTRAVADVARELWLSEGRVGLGMPEESGGYTYHYTTTTHGKPLWLMRAIALLQNTSFTTGFFNFYK
jgi:hypothetical protein